MESKCSSSLLLSSLGGVVTLLARMLRRAALAPGALVSNIMIANMRKFARPVIAERLDRMVLVQVVASTMEDAFSALVSAEMPAGCDEALAGAHRRRPICSLGTPPNIPPNFPHARPKGLPLLPIPASRWSVLIPASWAAGGEAGR